MAPTILAARRSNTPTSDHRISFGRSTAPKDKCGTIRREGVVRWLLRKAEFFSDLCFGNFPSKADPDAGEPFSAFFRFSARYQDREYPEVGFGETAADGR